MPFLAIARDAVVDCATAPCLDSPHAGARGSLSTNGGGTRSERSARSAQLRCRSRCRRRSCPRCRYRCAARSSRANAVVVAWVTAANSSANGVIAAPWP